MRTTATAASTIIIMTQADTPFGLGVGESLCFAATWVPGSGGLPFGVVSVEGGCETIVVPSKFVPSIVVENGLQLSESSSLGEQPETSVSSLHCSSALFSIKLMGNTCHTRLLSVIENPRSLFKALSITLSSSN